VSLSGGGLALNRSAITDDRGRFDFNAVPAGRFTIAASRAGFLSVEYGATQPGRLGSSLVVLAGQQLTDVRLQLARGAVVTGIVRDPQGSPVPDLTISLLRLQKPAGWAGVGNTRTDDRGTYRLFGLMPGRYLVVARPSILSFGEIRAQADAEVDAALQQLQQRASGRAVSSPAPATSVQQVSRPFVFAPIYHPSAVTTSDATPITLAAGDERSGVDITLQWVTTSSVEGTVIAPAGEPMPTFTSFELASEIDPYLPRVVGTAPGPDGKFRMVGVVPGQYRLTAQTTWPAERQPMVRDGVIVPARRTAGLWGSTDVTVSGGDVTGVTLVLRPGMTLAGRVVFDRSSLEPPADLTRLRVNILSRQNGGRGTGFGESRQVPAVVGADGSFAFPDLLPGTYILSSAMPGAAPGRGWWLRSVVINGRDILDEPFVLGTTADQIPSAVLTFSDRHTQLSGVLQTSAQQLASDYTIIAFPLDRTFWSLPFRRVQTTRPATDGRFTFVDLPAGDYGLAAVTDVAPGDWLDADFLAGLIASAVRVTLADGEQKTQNLRIVPGRPEGLPYD
jgi:hypothetical protein